MDKLKITRSELIDLIKLTEQERDVQINVFTYDGNNVEYVGLESRRLDYERDKLNGTNRIEKLIKQGYYTNNKSMISIGAILIVLCIIILLTLINK